MNLEAIKNRLAAKAKIRDANQSIREAKQNMKTTPDTEIKGYSGFTDPEERKILKDGGNFRDVEALRKSKAAAAAPALLEQMQAGKKPLMNQYEKDAVLALSIKSRPAAAHTPPPAAVEPSPAPVSEKPATAPTAPKATAPTPELTGLARATAAHQGKAMTPAAPKELSGLAKATAIHKANPKASDTPAPSGKVDLSGLTGLDKATAVHKAQADARKK